MSTTVSPIRVGKNSDRNFREIEKVLESASADVRPDTLVKRASDGSVDFSRGRFTAGLDISGGRSKLRSDLEVSPGIVIESDYQTGIFGAGYRLEANRQADGQSFFEIDNILVRGTLQAAVFQQDVVRAVGGDLFVTDSTVLSRNLTLIGTAAATLYVRDDVFEIGDILWVKDSYVPLKGIYTKYMEVTGTATAVGDIFSYPVNAIGGATVNLRAGSTVLRVGSSSDADRRGALYMTASATYGPYYDVYDSRTDSTAVDPKIRIGKLAGLNDVDFPTMGTGTDLYGIYVSGSAFIKGSIIASSGEIAGWTINSDNLAKNNATLHSSGYLLLGSGNDIIRVDAADATYRLWVGNATAASAPLTITKAGAVTATSATIKSAGSGKRVELRSSDNELEFFSASASVVRLGSSVLSAMPGINVADGIVYSNNTAEQFGGIFGHTHGTALGTGSFGVMGEISTVDTDDIEEPYGGVYGYADYSAIDGGTKTAAAKYIGVRGYALGAGATTEDISGKDFYGGHFEAEVGTPARFSGGTNYGIYATASGALTANWAGYFDAGNVKIVNNLNLGGYIDMAQIAAPGAAASGYTRIYTKNDGKLYRHPYGGSETEIGGGGSSTPAGSDTYVQYNNGGVMGGDSAFTFNDFTKTVFLSTAANGVYLHGGALVVDTVDYITSTSKALYIKKSVTATAAYIENTGAYTALEVKSGTTSGGVTIFKVINSTPTNIFTVTADGNISCEGSGSGVRFKDRSGSEWWQWYGSSSILRLFNGSTDILEISNGGNLQIDGTMKIDGTVSSTEGNLFLNNATKNHLILRSVGVGAPTFTTRSSGTKVVLWPSLSGTTYVDYALGVDSSVLWISIPDSASILKIYAGTTEVGRVNGSGDIIATRALQAKGDGGAVASTNTFTSTSQMGSSGATFTVKGTTGATARDSAGFIKIFVGVTAYYIPVFSAYSG